MAMINHLPDGHIEYWPAEGDIIFYKLTDKSAQERVGFIIIVDIPYDPKMSMLILDGKLHAVSIRFSMSNRHVAYLRIVRNGKLIIDWRRE